MRNNFQLWAILFVIMGMLAACGPETIEVTRIVANEEPVEVIVETTREVEVEVTRLVEVSQEVEVTRIVEQPVEMVRSVEMQFMVHQGLGMAGQDVYVMRDEELYRQKPDEIEDLLSETVFRAGSEIEADEFAVSDNPFGPFSADGAESMNMSFADWQAASGSGTYSEHANGANVDFSFQNLVPNSVYTLWCSRAKLPPDPVIVNLPCGELDGSQNQFRSDADGNLHLTMYLPARRDSSETNLSVFALAYHSDGQSWGAVPGPFGKFTHTHLLAPLPGPSDEAWQASTAPHTAGDPVRGREIFETGGGILSTPCIRCHSLDGSQKPKGGPSIMGVSAVAGDRLAELAAVDYLRESILDPEAYLVEDFEASMPNSYKVILSPEDIDALIAFLLTQ